MIYRGVGDLYLNLELRNVNSTLTTKDAKARLEDLTNKVLVKWITAIALQPACGDGGSCWTDYKTQAVEDKGFGWFITYIRNNVSWLKFLYQLMVRPTLFAQSNLLYYVNLPASFAWFWPSSFYTTVWRVAIPRFLRKADTKHTVDQSQRRTF